MREGGRARDIHLLARFSLPLGFMALLPADELEMIRKDYLDDMKRMAANVRTHAGSLSDGKRFKTSFPVLLYSAHQIKGSGGMLGFPELTEIGSRMAEVLGSFLEESEARPTAASLASSIVALSTELDEALGSLCTSRRGVVAGAARNPQG